MNGWRVVAAGALISALLVIGGCSSAEQPSEPAGEPAATETVDLAGTSWDCFSFGVSSRTYNVLADAPITAEFAADGTMSGSSGVNTYSTGYATDGEAMTIGPEIASTMMAGPEEAMTQETNFLTTLPTTASYNVLDSGELVLLGPAGNMVARFNPAE